MTLSRYDRDRDGLCDQPECVDVLALVEATSLTSIGADEVADRLEAIGIELRTDPEPFLRFYRQVADERREIPLAMGWNWAQDYPNASTSLGVMFASSGIRTTASPNVSLLGATPAQLRGWGYEVTSVPSADDRIDRCLAMVGLDQTECWADLDRYLMEEVVPVVPFASTESTHVVSERVASFSSSAATGELALDRIALVPGSG